MDKRYFEFESIVSKDESGTLKIDLGSEINTGMRFTLNFSNLMMIKSLFEFVSFLATVKDANYNRYMIDYKDWYANEIIKRITQDDTHFKSQSDAKKDVLRELLQRRNKLQKQIQKAMSFYDENKGRIDEMEKRRANFQKPYFGPMMSFTRDYLIFENVTEYGDIYYQLSIKTPTGGNQDENNPGYGWVEFSRTFHEELSHSLVSNKQNITITNLKPRSDIRVLRRTDTQPMHLFKTSMRAKSTIQQVPIVLFSIYEEITNKFSITKSQLYVLLDKVVNNFPDNRKIKFRITSHANEFLVKSTNQGLEVKLHDEKLLLENFEVEVNTSLFYSIRPLFYLINEVKIHLLSVLFGFILKLNLVNGELVLQSNTLHSREHRYLRLIHLNYLSKSTSEENKRGQTLHNLLSGRFNLTPNQELYQREFEILTNEEDQREELAFDLLTYYPERINLEEHKIHYEDDEIVAFIDLKDITLIDNWTCSCEGFNKQFKCSHLIACYYYLVKEGLYIA